MLKIWTVNLFKSCKVESPSILIIKKNIRHLNTILVFQTFQMKVAVSRDYFSIPKALFESLVLAVAEPFRTC